MMLRALFLTTLLLVQPAWAAEKRIYKVDSVIATIHGQIIRIEAKGAVESGGWKAARLKQVHGDAHSLSFEMVAVPPPAGMTVLDAIVPVVATAQIKLRHSPDSVRVEAQANEVTTQVLH